MYVIQAHQDWPCCLACRRPVKLQYIFANYMSTKRLCVLLLIALNDHKASGVCSAGQTDPNIYCLFMFMYIQHAQTPTDLNLKHYQYKISNNFLPTYDYGTPLAQSSSSHFFKANQLKAFAITNSRITIHQQIKKH